MEPGCLKVEDGTDDYIDVIFTDIAEGNKIEEECGEKL